MTMPPNIKDPPHFQEMVRAAQAHYDALSPIEKAIHDMERKRSGCIGLSKMSIPREEIARRIDAMPEFVILAELKRLRALISIPA